MSDANFSFFCFRTYLNFLFRAKKLFVTKKVAPTDLMALTCCLRLECYLSQMLRRAVALKHGLCPSVEIHRRYVPLSKFLR